MALSDIRNRARFLFLAVMVGHTLLISSQVTSKRGVSLLREALTAVVVQAQSAAWFVVGGVRDTWSAYVALRGVREENQRLVDEVATLRVALQQERARSRGTDQLRTLLGLRTQLGWDTIGAEVIAGSTSPEFRAVTIDRGTAAGVRTDMAVLGTAGVVGRVVQPASEAASVQLLIDRNAAAAVTVARSGAQGIALGYGDTLLRLEYLSAIADVREGDVVVTAGLDGIYPKGLPVGRVVSLERSGASLRLATVQPVVDFSSLQTVLVVRTRPPAPEGRLP